LNWINQIARNQINTAKMEVLILKTNIRYKKQVKTVAPLLDGRDSISRWNIDLEDIDKVLRIESNDIELTEIVQLIHNAGFQCEELAD
jgi:tRNA G26 N,N-dimethylase Trm1